MMTARDRALELLAQHFSGLLARGVSRVPLSPESRKMLAELPVRTGDRASEAAPASSPKELRSMLRASAEAWKSEPPPPPDARPEDLPLPRDASAARIQPSGATKEEKLADIERLMAASKPIAELSSLRKKLVFATGNADARLMLVGEAPGEEEELKGEPFVGRAGELLMKILAAMGLKRQDVYITNVLKHRPAMGSEASQGSNNRPPTVEEMALCIPFLRAEIEVVRPEIIIAVGGTAAAGLLGREKVSVAALRGSEQSFEGRPVIVTYHPSYLLRSESQGPDISKREKRKVWEDMLRVMQRLHMPVSEKQRRYFL